MHTQKENKPPINPNKMLNTIPEKTHTFTKEDSIKGGQSKSKKKTLGQKIRRLRERGCTEENCKRIYQIMSDNELDSADAIKTILDLEAQMKKDNWDVSTRDKIAFQKLRLEWSKLRHPVAKVQIQNNTQINNIISDVDIKEKIKEILGKD